MKKILVLFLVLSLVAAMVACTQTVRITIENPAEIKLEKAGGSVAITLTDAKTVNRITDVVCQIPLQEAEASDADWTYRLTWTDAEGNRITRIEIAGSQIRWEGKSYSLSVGIDLSVVTDVLETIPGVNK